MATTRCDAPWCVAPYKKPDLDRLESGDVQQRLLDLVGIVAIVSIHAARAGQGVSGIQKTAVAETVITSRLLGALARVLQVL